MPRLIGKRSNTGASLGLLVAVFLTAAVGVEYLGVVDLIPKFGRDQIELKLNRKAQSTTATIS